MENRADLQLIDFHHWAENNGISYTLSFWESCGNWEIEIHSAAGAERFYQKRVYDFRQFMDAWEKHVKTEVSRQEGKEK